MKTSQFVNCLLPTLPRTRKGKFLHGNAHASALWDFLVRKTGKFYDTWDQLYEWVRSPKQRREDVPRFGFLLEGLLRRNEKSCRTSIFLALDRFADNGRDEKLHQFAGGTLLGVERPGIPFEQERFEKISRRLLPTALAVADSCITLSRNQRKRLLEERRGVRDSVLGLLNTYPFAVGREEDHDISSKNLDTLPFLKELVSVVPSIKDHWKSTRGDYSSCTNTQKNLFYCFQSGTVAAERDLPDMLNLPSPPTVGHSVVSCLECFHVIFDRLVPGVDRDPLPAVEWEDGALCASLPSFPGIRFLVAVADFLYAVELGRQQKALKGSSYAWISKIRLKPGCLSIKWTGNARPFLYALARNYQSEEPHLLGTELKRIRESTIQHVEQIGLNPRIYGLLTSPKLYRFVYPLVDPEKQEIRFIWEVGTQ